jgi:FixJ family two-component response regulator
MPDISGLEVMRRIRGTREDIEFIVMTGFPSIDAAIDALRTYRAYDFITKPIDNIRTFTKTIDQALERRRLRVEKQALIDRLRRTNETLRREVEERRQAEAALRKSQRMLEAESGRLARKNTALEVLLEKRQGDKADLEKHMHFNVRRLIQPQIDLLKETKLNSHQHTLLRSISSNLDEIVTPLMPGLPVPYLGFTAKEIQIINQVKQGKSTKEIAELLHLSQRTIETHRNNIRQKLGICHEKINLRTYLLSLQTDGEY